MRRAREETFWAWALILPTLAGLALFTYLPTLASFALGFCRWDLLSAPRWVGLENYRAILGDPLFWNAMGNTALFALASGALEIALALGFALLLNRAVAGRALFRTAYFLPYVTPLVSVALAWGWIYDPEFGLLNWLLALKPPIAWLYQPNTALAALIAIKIWKNIGYTLILLLAGLQAIPASAMESAMIDGAGRWGRFWHVLLPLLSPTLFFVAIITLINSVQTFDTAFLLTQGGPEHRTDLLAYWIFKNAFEFYKIGPASAMACVMFCALAALTLWQWRMRRRWVLYEN
ncbi:MAG: sugar ABC transporter permease [Vampirovibrionales bacterium]|nr:sugar ABC transporter permease [Vampirovibrionales bacterium]